MDWYTGNTTYDTVLSVAFAFAAFVLVGGMFAQSPYGRFASTKVRLPRGSWMRGRSTMRQFSIIFALLLRAPCPSSPLPLA